MVDSALVLGPGGPVGTAWLAGLAAGLRREGVDLGAPPITIGGRRYIDGALRAGTNLDLAGDARVVIVAEPMAHAYDTSSTAAGAQEVVRLVPDADAIKELGPDLTAWVPAYQAGVRQAPSAAERIRACSAVI